MASGELEYFSNNRQRMNYAHFRSVGLCVGSGVEWPFGKLRGMLEYKLKRLGVKLVKVDERGTSGACPVCAEYTKQNGRIYKCSHCGFTGAHRDVIGASGILDKSANGGFTKGRRLPEQVVYSRPKVLTPAA